MKPVSKNMVAKKTSYENRFCKKSKLFDIKELTKEMS